jgi:hypothetical protein
MDTLNWIFVFLVPMQCLARELVVAMDGMICHLATTFFTARPAISLLHTMGDAVRYLMTQFGMQNLSSRKPAPI